MSYRVELIAVSVCLFLVISDVEHYLNKFLKIYLFERVTKRKRESRSVGDLHLATDAQLAV